MTRTEDGLAPRRLTSRDMAQVLAAIVARRPEVAELGRDFPVVSA